MIAQVSLGPLEQSILGAALLFFGGIIVYLIRKVVEVSNHNSVGLRTVVMDNTAALTKMETALESNTRVLERFESFMTRENEPT